ncbi:MAG TPA: 50S ribosomal protein L11 methyltransferase [Halothiobacillus sp.]|nr:50S ribosomal protein L11 methyltransferase [Halothiobacillus sp.]
MTEQTSWVQVSLTVPQSMVATVEDALLEAGALSVTLLDSDDVPVLEPLPGETPLWPNVKVVGLFDADHDPSTIKRYLHAALPPQYLDSFDYETLADDDWTRKWMDEFKPQQFGERLWIIPSWVKQPPEPEAITVRLDPGLAFGTGNHPTTALCLEWLAGQELANKRVLDFGCGSGILAIAALKLGAKSAWGVDIDPQALTATVDNGKANEIASERLQATLPEALPTDAGFEVLVANILANPLIELAESMSRHLLPQGQFALSGILNEQADAVAAAYRQAGLVVDGIRQNGDWSLIFGHRA